LETAQGSDGCTPCLVHTKASHNSSSSAERLREAPAWLTFPSSSLSLHCDRKVSIQVVVRQAIMRMRSSRSFAASWAHMAPLLV
jgi:hypothetical protein